MDGTLDLRVGNRATAAGARVGDSYGAFAGFAISLLWASPLYVTLAAVEIGLRLVVVLGGAAAVLVALLRALSVGLREGAAGPRRELHGRATRAEQNLTEAKIAKIERRYGMADHRG